MGTRFELVLGGDDEGQLRAAGEAALEEISRAERQLSLFRRDSQISHLNRHGASGPVPLDPEVLRLLARCRELWAATEGAFDPGVGPLMEVWGFRGERASGPPDAPTLDELRGMIGLRHLEIDQRAGTARFATSALRLDLGAVGKGHALDQAAEVLREAGVPRALLHGGTSTVLTLGAPPPGQERWRIALEDPRPGGGRLAEVRLGEGALAVSTPRGRIAASGAHGHLIDPRSGRPSADALLAAVLHPSATVADAWSTALCVLGNVAACAADPELTGFVVCAGCDGDGLTCHVAGPHAAAFALGG